MQPGRLTTRWDCGTVQCRGHRRNRVQKPQYTPGGAPTCGKLCFRGVLSQRSSVIKRRSAIDDRHSEQRVPEMDQHHRLQGRQHPACTKMSFVRVLACPLFVQLVRQSGSLGMEATQPVSSLAAQHHHWEVPSSNIPLLHMLRNGILHARSIT